MFNTLPVSTDSYQYLYHEIKSSFMAICRIFGTEEKMLSQTQKEKITLIQMKNDVESTSRIVQRATFCTSQFSTAGQR